MNLVHTHLFLKSTVTSLAITTSNLSWVNLVYLPIQSAFQKLKSIPILRAMINAILWIGSRSLTS